MKCLEKEARVLAIDVQKGEVEKGIELLAAAETVAHRRKKKTLIYDFPEGQKDLYQIFSGAGYEIETKDSVISVQTKDLIASKGVTKLLDRKFPGIDAYVFGDMMIYQLEEIEELLERYHFPISMDRIQKYDDRFSYAVYDEASYTPQAVLLASAGESEIIVDLLLNFSTKKLRYTLAVCKSFVRGLMKEKRCEEYTEISALTMNVGVPGFVKRLLNPGAEPTEKSAVLRAKKDVTEKMEEIRDSKKDPEDPFVSSYQKTINEKYIWNFGKKNE